MAGSVNRAILIGNVGKDPTTRTTQSGIKIVSFSLATTERWKKDGEPQQETSWHNIVVFNQHLVEVAEKYVRKGVPLYVEGAVKPRKYEKDGRDHYITEIVVPAFGGALVLLAAQGAQGRTEERQPDQRPGMGQAQQRAPAGGGGYQPAAGGGGGDLDDEIPF